MLCHINNGACGIYKRSPYVFPIQVASGIPGQDITKLMRVVCATIYCPRIPSVGIKSKIIFSTTTMIHDRLTS